MGRTIGSGGFAIVKMVRERHSGDIWACKVMNLPGKGTERNEFGSSREDIFKEIDILLTLDHPNIVYIRECFEERNRVYIIMEYMRGGELLQALATAGRYTEDDARTIFRQLMHGVKYMHGKGIVHRDLKLGNLLLVKKGDISEIKIADFGFAKRYVLSSLSTICGTPRYLAPEIIMVSAITRVI